MRYPLDELLDKRSIIKLKIERIDDKEDIPNLEKEFRDYSKAIQKYIQESVCTKQQVNKWYDDLYEANGKTWDLETNIRKGQLGNMSLEKVGETAIKIRESNGIRIRIKSDIVETIGQDIKT